MLGAGSLLAAEPDAATALAEGRCSDAATLATEQTGFAPGSASSWRVLGDARRCLGEARPAVLAYLRYLDLAGPDAGVEALVATLRDRLGDLRVTVVTDRPAPLRVEATPPGEPEPVAARLQPDGSWLFEDLEPGTKPTIVVRGTGIAEVRAPSPQILVGAESTMTLTPGWRGIGVVELSVPPPAGSRVEALAVDGWQKLSSDGQVRLTAGEQPLVVVGEQGRVGTTVLVPADGRVMFDPTPWVPATLTVSGAPAGAQVRLFLEGVQPPLERTVDIDPVAGQVDPDFGIRLAPPLLIEGVVGGPGSVVLTHPALGFTASELVLEAGAANGVELDWRALEHAPAVQQEYLTWLGARQRVQREATGRVVVGVSVGAAGAVLSTIGWIAAGASSRTLTDARTAALAGDPHPDGPDGWLADHADAAQAERAWIAVGVAGAGVGALGVTLAGVFGADGQVRLQRLGAWTPP